MKSKILKIISFLAVALIVSSCLKDDIGLDWTDSVKGKMYAEVHYWYSGFQVTALQPVPDDVVFRFMINIATDELPTEDITVSVAVNASVLAKYNSLKGTAYQLYPYIEVLTPTVTVKAGTRTTYARVRVWNADLLNPCDNFMAPISITEATGGAIVANPLGQGSCLMALPISNPWAGFYHAFGYRNHPVNGIEPFDWSSQELTTVNCEKVHKAIVGNYSGYGLDIKVTQNTMDVGGTQVFKCELQVTDMSDPTDFIVYPDDAGAPMNYYNPVTKTFELFYAYNKAAPRIIRETLVRNL
ncbi:MAG: DUF1735 domain-containing protein [Bacteroidales bacterium]|nr:DUF1735 domain-containing protein [Bacteroidales bacterium]